MYRHKILLVFLTGVLLSCKGDDAPQCTTCTSTVTAPFELCKESDGTASVNGEYTFVDYNVYLEGLREDGAECD